MEEIKSDSVSPEDGRTTDSTHGIGTPQAGEDKKGFDPESTGCATANGASQPSSEYSSGNGTSQSQPASRSRKIRVRKKKPPTSKYRGVCEERGKWRAQTSVHSKRCFLGTYDTEIEAALGTYFDLCCHYAGSSYTHHVPHPLFCCVQLTTPL